MGENILPDTCTGEGGDFKPKMMIKWKVCI